MVAPEYVHRLADDLLSELMEDLPALMLVGPRASGKTTTAARHADHVIRLDVELEAEPVRADPDAALRRLDGTVLLDEWQHVPEVLGAVKRAVDTDRHPGRFLLTGSVHARFSGAMWPGTGRVVDLPMFGLTERELAGRTARRDFIDLLRTDDPDAFAPDDPPDLPGYLELALRGGFPDAALGSGGAPRARWLETYLRQLLTHDVHQIGDPNPSKLARYVEALAASSAGIVQDKTLWQAAGIDKRTASAYDGLLVDLFVLDNLPPWLPNRLSRLVKSPKRYLVDPSLLGAALRLDVDALMRNGDLLGRVVDTFVAAQLRPEVSLRTDARLHHLRERDGRREVDLVVELGGGRVVAVEVKASGVVRPDDARHLFWLSERLGDDFLAGAVLHTGPRPYRLGPKVLALPIASLWAP